MTQLLIRLFIRRPNSPQEPRVRAAYGNLASVVGMVCNILLCLGKFVVGTLFGSIAITADALNNLSDASSNIVSLVGFKLWMSGFNRTIGRIISSETLIATAADSRNDVLSTAAVLVAAILCRVTGWDVLDGLMGVGVAVFILISGWGLVMDTLSPLLGESPSEDLVEHIEQTVMGYPGVLGVHDLMVHDYGPGHQFASIHVELPAEQDPLEAHDLIDNIERDFMKHDHLMVTIHYDPIVTSDAAVGVLRSRLTEKLRQLDPALSLHDLRIVPGKTHTNVLFDLVLPAGYAGDKVELLTQMEQFIKEQDPTYNCIIKLEQSYTAAAHK